MRKWISDLFLKRRPSERVHGANDADAIPLATQSIEPGTRVVSRRDVPASHSSDRSDIPEDLTRRYLGTALLGGVGIAALAGCVESGADEDLGSVTQAASGTDVRWVDTVLGTSRNGDLAITPAVAATIVVAKGCRVAGDGGGGVFYWNSTTGPADDGGTIIVPKTSGTGGVGQTGPYWKRIYGGALNVRWFGAAGDATTADDDAIKNAIKAASGGADIYIPRGTYRTTSRINIDSLSSANHVRIRGDGMSSVILPQNGTFNTIEITSRDNIEISNLWLEETTKTAGKSIYAVNAANLKLLDLVVFQPYEGIHLHNVNVVDVERVGVQQPRSTGLAGGRSYGIWISGGGNLPGWTTRSDH